MKRFEVLWYVGEKDTFGDYETKDFSTLQAAMNFYNKHKDDQDKYGWWVTKRNSNWEVIEDYVY